MPALTVHNAEIKTAAVEIRTLTISGKQVTLAVFRQLVESSPIESEDGQFRGTPWGVVNYHPDKCADKGTHLHVVWQFDAELRRGTVFAPTWYKQSEAFFEEGNFIQATYCANGHRLPEWAERKRDREDGNYYIYFKFDNLGCVALEPGPSYVRSGQHECGVDVEEERRTFAAEVAAEQERRRQIDARWDEILALPQLFIAV